MNQNPPSEKTRSPLTRWIWHILSFGLTQRDTKNSLRFVAWTFAWGVAFVAGTWILTADTVSLPLGVMWLIALIPIVISISAFVVYLRFLRNADELTRKIQIESLAIGFGAGVIFLTGYHMLELAGAPEIGFADALVVMMIAWSIGQIWGEKRYR